jgi:hypothetical protein
VDEAAALRARRLAIWDRLGSGVRKAYWPWFGIWMVVELVLGASHLHRALAVWSRLLWASLPLGLVLIGIAEVMTRAEGEGVRRVLWRRFGGLLIVWAVIALIAGVYLVVRAVS